MVNNPQDAPMNVIARAQKGTLVRMWRNGGFGTFPWFDWVVSLIKVCSSWKVMWRLELQGNKGSKSNLNYHGDSWMTGRGIKTSEVQYNTKYHSSTSNEIKVWIPTNVFWHDTSQNKPNDSTSLGARPYESYKLASLRSRYPLTNQGCSCRSYRTLGLNKVYERSNLLFTISLH